MYMAVLLAFAAIGADPLSESAKKELQLFQGKWVIVSGERNGKKFELPKR